MGRPYLPDNFDITLMQSYVYSIFAPGTIFGGSWCRYFISITQHQCYIEATWKTRPKNDLDGKQKSSNNLQYQNYLTN